MVIVTAKLNKVKIAGVFVAAAAVILLVILLANRTGGDQETSARRKLDTPESKVSFLSSCGYTVAPDPVRVQEVRIPEDWSEDYAQYNRLQQSQGFDLSRYKGKTVMQYVYQVENYPGDNGEPVYATLLLSRHKLIGADLSRGGTESFLRPLLTA